jgi:hypothetical protein
MLWPAQTRAAEQPLWEVGLGIEALGFTGPLFANRRYNSYFYSVGTQFPAAASRRVETTD